MYRISPAERRIADSGFSQCIPGRGDKHCPASFHLSGLGVQHADNSVFEMAEITKETLSHIASGMNKKPHRHISEKSENMPVGNSFFLILL